VPDSARSKISGWANYVDYWAVNFTYSATNHGKIFHNQWQSYRTHVNRTLERNASHNYDEPGSYTILVKVIDIFGNDTIISSAGVSNVSGPGRRGWRGHKRV
jgi:adenine-specific DNA-methyltransferase